MLTLKDIENGVEVFTRKYGHRPNRVRMTQADLDGIAEEVRLEGSMLSPDTRLMGMEVFVEEEDRVRIESDGPMPDGSWPFHWHGDPK